MGRLVINGEEVYELDEECLKEKGALQNRWRGMPEREGRNCGKEAGEGDVSCVKFPRIR